MKEKPIIFSTEMIKAILDSRKTITRRAIKPQPKLRVPDEQYKANMAKLIYLCPYGQVGNELWVRESLRWSKVGIPTRYSADDCPVFRDGETPNKWPFRTQVLPSIFMPRWASRITLEITEVRVEKVQEIQSADITKEGIELGIDLYNQQRNSFIRLWDSLNAKRGYSWENNPWVWVISFRRINQ